MLEELRNASNQLRAALDHYVRICSNLQGVCLQGSVPEDISPDYVEQVDRELGLIESYDVKMQLAKTAIKFTRNYAFNLPTINRLPTEILSRILHRARDLEPRSVGFIAQVCSRWRTFALSSPSLWSRVDFHPLLCEDFYPLLRRAQAHISRSSGLPLDVHISAVPEYGINGYYDEPMVAQCELAAPRMRSLGLDIRDFDPGELCNSTHPAISSLFSHCTPGLFTKITTHYDKFGFLASNRVNGRGWSMQLEVAHSRFEVSLASVSVLNLTGLYLPWTSRAYHGLVELRLVNSVDGRDSITEWELVNILEASPGLRILQINLRITDRIDENLDVSVSLPDLEVLEVDSDIFYQDKLCYLKLVRFLMPGSRPLCFTIHCYGLQLAESSKAYTQAFLERSNVTQFHADRVIYPLDLLPSVPHLKALALTDWASFRADQPAFVESSNQQNTNSVIYPKLDLCVVLKRSFLVDELRSITQQCHVQTLMIYGSKFYRGTDRQEVDTETLMTELSQVCPNIKIPNKIPAFIEHHGFFFDFTLLS